MGLLVWAGIGLLGGSGAVLRFVLDGAVSSRLSGAFAFGTFAVNMGGAFALGLLVGLGVGGDGLRLAGAGLLGGFTTFSTWMLESERLAEEGERPAALLNLALSLELGAGLAWIGMTIGETL